MNTGLASIRASPSNFERKNQERYRMKHDDEKIRSAIQELIIHLLAVLNGGEGLEGRFRVVMISRSAMLVTNLHILKDRVPTPIVSKDRKSSISVERLHLSEVYCMHVLPVIHMQGLTGKSADEAKDLWVPRNVEIVRRKEKGNILFITTTDEVKEVFVGGYPTNPVKDSSHVVVRFSEALSAMVMIPTETQLKQWSGAYTASTAHVGYDEMFDLLLLAATQGINGN